MNRRKRTGKWSIRSKITALLLLPLISLTALWAYAADLSLGNALTLRHEHTIGTRLADPLGRLIFTLHSERRGALVSRISAHGDAQALRPGRAATDMAVDTLLRQAHSPSVRDDENTAVRRAMDDTERALVGLRTLRESTDKRTLTRQQVIDGYTSIDTSIAGALRAMTILPDQKAQDFGQALYTVVPAGERLSLEDTLISGAASSPGHRLTLDDYSALVQDIGSQRLLNADLLAQLPPAQRKPYAAMAGPTSPLGRITAMENELIAAGPHAHRLPFPISQWRTAYDAYDKKSTEVALGQISEIFVRTGPPAHRALVALVLSGVLGLVALIASVILSVRVGRSLVGDVARLRGSARNLTDDQLRDVVGRLRRGEKVDVRGAMTRPTFVNREMAELGAAFDALQLTAVDLAEEDIRLHRGINDIFVNLARRNQTLVHRQLRMLDELERHEEDPAALEHLFRLDQLATRMRRYSEGLIIVSGAPPGRFWRRSVPAVDVVRGAVAETEDYARVMLTPVPDVGIHGRAAADVIHLLAELVENAEVFSSTDSEVRVTTGAAAGGLVVEIDDRGLGMSEEELATANARIATPLDVSALDSTRLGLVTVGRLARRHHIGVTLRRSPYGGVNAIVLIPQDLLDWERHESADAPGMAPTSLTGEDSRFIAARRLRGAGETLDGVETDELALGTSTFLRQGFATPSHPGQAHPRQSRTWQVAPAAVPGPAAPPAPSPRTSLPPHAAAVTWAHVPADPAPVDFPSLSSSNSFSPEAEFVDGLPRRVPQASLARELMDESQEAGTSRLMNWNSSVTGPAAARRERYAAGAALEAPWTPAPDGSADAASSVPISDAYPRASAAADQEGPQSAGGRHAAGGHGRPEHIRSTMSSLQAGMARARLGGNGAYAGAARPAPSSASPHPSHRGPDDERQDGR